MLNECFVIGLGRWVPESNLREALVARFPTAVIASLTDDRGADIVFELEYSTSSRWQTSVTFWSYPTDDESVVDVGVALSAWLSLEFATDTLSDGSGLGNDEGPFWCVVCREGVPFLADDSDTDPFEGRGKPERVVGPLGRPVLQLLADGRAVPL